MINLKQYNNNDIDIFSLLNNLNDRIDFTDFFYQDKSSWCSGVIPSLNDRCDMVGSFINLDNKIMFDIGAHCGFFSIMFNKIFEQIYSFEPFNKHFQFLQLFVSNFHNIYPINSAISINTQKDALFVDNVNNTQTSLIPHPYSREVLNIDCIRLDDFSQKYDIQKIDFVKIDIEGFELPLITDNSFDNISAKIKKIYIECHNIEDGINDMKMIDVQRLICNKLNILNFKLEIVDDMIFAINNVC